MLPKIRLSQLWRPPRIPALPISPHVYSLLRQRFVLQYMVVTRHPCDVVHIQRNLKKFREWSLHDRGVLQDIIWSPCGRFVACLIQTQFMIVWCLETDEKCDVWFNENCGLFTWHFYEGLITLTEKGRLNVYTHRGTLLIQPCPAKQVRFDGLILAMALHKNGRQLAISGIHQLHVLTYPALETMWAIPLTFLVSELYWTDTSHVLVQSATSEWLKLVNDDKELVPYKYGEYVW